MLSRVAESLYWMSQYVERAESYPTELYDLEADPGEARNVADDAKYHKQRDALHAELTKYFADYGAPPIEEWRKTTEQKLPGER